MKNIELFYFLGKCLSLGHNEEKDQEVIHIIRQGKVNWERFVAKASNHLVLPSVYVRFKRMGILPDLPPGLSEHLQMVYQLNYKRNVSLLKQVNRINFLLAQVGIVPIYLKGTGNLLDHLYEDIGERMLGDIDLLVSDDQFLQTAEVLKREGYDHAYPFFEADQSATKHFPRLVHPTEPADVEVHRVPVEMDLSDHFNYQIIHPEIKFIDTSPPCYVLSDRHKVVLNFMHGFMSKDIRMMRMVSYRNMIDLFFLSHRVDVYKALGGLTQFAHQALIYADFVNHSMGISNAYLPGSPSKRFIRRHDMFLGSRFTFRIQWLTSYLFSRIWSGYIRNAAGVIFSKQIRRSVFRRLSTPSWYVSHLNSYAQNFKKNLG